MKWDYKKLHDEYIEYKNYETAGVISRLSGNEYKNGIVESADGYVFTLGRLFFSIQNSGKEVKCLLCDKSEPRIWADSMYNFVLSYTEGDKYLNNVEKTILWPDKIELGKLEKTRTDLYEVSLRAYMGDVLVVVNYKIPEDGHCIDEYISVENQSAGSIRLSDWDFGMSRRLTQYAWMYHTCEDLKTLRAVSVPWRNTVSGVPDKFQDYSLSQLCHIKGSHGSCKEPHNLNAEFDTGLSFEGLPSDGWILTQDNISLLIIKYNQQDIEHSVLRTGTRDVEPQEKYHFTSKDGSHEFLTFGGSMRCRQDPTIETIESGGRVNFGFTRYVLFEGEWKTGYGIFRKFMDAMGNKYPREYNPPFNWNELYDMYEKRYQHLEEDREVIKQKRALYFTRESMFEEAEKALNYNCDLLYLDPGWDTAFASGIWDESRMGRLEDFVRELREKYNLKLGVQICLAGWSDPLTFPKEVYLVDHNGKVHEEHLCAGAEVYLDEMWSRLEKLIDGGITFFLFDGTYYTGMCYAKDHGHPVPFTRDEQVEVFNELIRKMHDKNPDILIERHDFIGSGIPNPYCPSYLKYGKGGFDEIWGWELMWEPLEDLRSGRALALYYFNLAYNIPVYLHIDLRKETDNCLMFWWYASTCRHLGIGGTHENGQIRAKLIRSTEFYSKNREYFSRGTFIGIDEYTHLHVLPEKPGGIIALFNLEEQVKRKKVTISKKDLNIDNISNLTLELLEPENEKFMLRDTGNDIEIEISMRPVSSEVVKLVKSI